MIRRAEERDWSGVARLWLEANIDAHDFIPAQYWEANFEAVKDMLPQAEVLVWEGEDGIQGFVGLHRGDLSPERVPFRRHWKGAAGSCEAGQRAARPPGL